jgi:hypothetical protein
MKKLSVITALIPLFALISCSSEEQQPVVQTKVEKPVPPPPPPIEYDIIRIDSNKRFAIEYFLITADEKSKFSKGKEIEYSEIGDMDDNETAGYTYTTDGSTGSHWRNNQSESVPEPSYNNTIFETTVKDTVRKITVVSSYKTYGFYYQMGGYGAEQVMCDFKSKKITDEARAKWNLVIGDGEKNLSFKFTKDGAEVPKQFSNDFKKLFSL